MDIDLAEKFGQDFVNFNHKLFVRLADFGIDIVPVINEPSRVYTSTVQSHCKALELVPIYFNTVKELTDLLHAKAKKFIDDVPSVSYSNNRKFFITYSYPELIDIPDRKYQMNYCFIYIN